MLYEDKLLRFAVAAMPLVAWDGCGRSEAEIAARAMAIAVEMEAAFSATLKARRDAAEQAARAARAAAEAVTGAPLCARCGHSAARHADGGECMFPDCLCRLYECAAVQP